MVVYTYNYAKKVNTDQLCVEIDAGMGLVLDGTDGYIDACCNDTDCVFFVELSGPEEADLDTIVANHTITDFYNHYLSYLTNFGVVPETTDLTSWVIVPCYLAFPDDRPDVVDYVFRVVFTAIISVDNAGETVHAVLYDVTDSGIVTGTEVTHTGDTDDTVKMCTPVIIDPTHYFALAYKSAGDEGGALAGIKGASLKLMICKKWQL